MSTYLGQRHDELVRIGHLRCRSHFVVGGVGLAEANVLLDRSGEEHGLLTDDADVCTQPCDVERANVSTIEQHSALFGIVEALDELDGGAFCERRGEETSDGVGGKERDSLPHPEAPTRATVLPAR